MSDLDRLFSGELRAVIIRADSSTTPATDGSGWIVLAGSFNPLHHGHRKLLEAAEEISGRIGIFEISIENVDKPDIERVELERRIAQFRGVADVAVTRSKLFTDKAGLLPGAWFVIGFDTAVRLLDDRYYKDGGAEPVMLRLMRAGVKFLVAGRAGEDGRFRGLESLEVPPGLINMFIPVPESRFREDISSTELRRHGRG